MFFHQFVIIFNSLNEIEESFKKYPTEQEKIKLANQLLMLRDTMDECLKYWLYFEDKVNELQNKYAFSLPDLLSDDFFENLFQDCERKSKKREYQHSNVKKGTLFFQLESVQGVSSFRKGMGFWDLAMLEEAIREFEKLVELEPNYIFGHFCLGLAYSQKGLTEKALSKLRLVKALSQDNRLKALVHNSMGNIYVNENKFGEALAEFGMAVEEDPSFYIGYFNMGAVYYNMHGYKEAAYAFERAKELSPNDWEIYYYLGKAYVLLGDLKKGLQNLNKAFALNPLEKKILFMIGKIYDIMGDKRNARFYYNRVQENHHQS